MPGWVWFVLGAATMAALDFSDIHISTRVCAGHCGEAVPAQERQHGKVPAH